MFENLSERLTRTLRAVAGRARLSDENINEALRDVRTALLEADVALSVVKDFIERIRVRAIGQEVATSLTPGQALVKLVHDELVELMGAANDQLNLTAAPPAIVLMAGLQGVGKTTTVAKLARFLRERQKKKVAVVSTDVYRPAAIDQLQTLASEVGAVFIASRPDEAPVAIALRAVAEARTKFADVLIVDTAGRLAIDADMMTEIRALHAALNPIETLFVVDAMTGQDAANTAKAFNDALPLTGVVLAKSDGDARGGAALSVRAITGKPIKFLGVGEKTEALEPFHPDRIASRILGMGDVLTLIEEAERKVDRDKAERLAKEDPEGRALRSRGFPRAAASDVQHGRRLEHAREAARHGPAAARRTGAAGRWLVQADGRDHRFDDPSRAAFPRRDQRFAQAPYRDGQRHADPGHQSPAETAQADAEDDEEGHQEGRHGEDDAAGFEPQRRRRNRGPRG